MEPTRERIITAALNLFSEHGFDAVSVAQIAEAVGIKAPSLYKHFSSKQHIFDAILESMAKRYEAQMRVMQMNGVEANKDVSLFTTIDEKTLIMMGKQFFTFFLHDEYVSKFRRLMMIEQFHNRTLADLYVKQYIEDTLDYQSTLFKMMKFMGVFKDEDENIMALHFYAPMYLLLTMCDSHPEKEAIALVKIEEHIHTFNRLYRKEAMK